MPDNNRLPAITRPQSGAVVAGVCAGLARRLNMDPNLLRIAVVIGSFFGGFGLIAYGTGLLVMPREGQSEPLVRKLLPFTRAWSRGAVVAVTVIVAILLAAIAGTGGTAMGALVVAFCIWYFGFRGRNQRPTIAPPAEPTPFERAADSWRDRLIEQETPGYVSQPEARTGYAEPPSRATMAASSEPRWQQPYTDPAADLAVRDDDLPVAVRSRPRRWTIWVLALVLSGTGVALVGLLGMLGLPATPLAYAAAVLIGLGLALLASVRRGRPPLLLAATLIAAITTAGLLAQDAGPRVPGLGVESYTYATEAELPPTIDHDAGNLTIDLSQLDLTSERHLKISAGAGSVSVKLPTGTTTVLTYSVDVGTAKIMGTEHGGLNVKGQETVKIGTGDPVLKLDVELDVGELTVRS